MLIQITLLLNLKFFMLREFLKCQFLFTSILFLIVFSSKVTLLSLISHFFSQVMLDGNNVKDFNVKWMRSNFGVVSQEPVLFDLSIGDNIRFGVVHGASQGEIEDAAKLANAHDFIMALPKVHKHLRSVNHL